MTEEFFSVQIYVTNSRGEILMNLRDDKPDICWPDHWFVFGGHREGAETPYETAVRELREETGIEAVGLVPFEAVPYGDHSLTDHRLFRMSWEGSAADWIVGEGREHRWVPISEVPSMKVPAHIADYIRQLGDS